MLCDRQLILQSGENLYAGSILKILLKYLNDVGSDCISS